MAKKKEKVYVVRKGHQTGIYTDWNECERQISGFSCAEYRSFSPNDHKSINNYLKGKSVQGNKYYAVKRGRRIGVYTSWEECKKQTDGLESAVYKSFPTEAEAYIFLGIKNKKELRQLEIEQAQFYDKYSNYVNVYVDGSFNSNIEIYSAAFVVVKDETAIHQYARVGHDKQAASKIKHLAGELSAAMMGASFVAKKGFKKVMLYHDNLSIRNLIEGTQKPKNEFQHKYIRYMDNLKQTYRIKIEFTKIKAHNGNKWNELVDTLAKEAIEKYKKVLV